MRYRFFTCDVFTTERFGGNPLAVLPDAAGLSDRQMQLIAREFNYSESTFVSPSASKYTATVRIFTPTAEIPFAGHPNIGTAFVLATDGVFGEIGDGLTVTFAEAAGPVPVTIRRDDAGRIWCELAAPRRLTLGETVDAARVAAALSLDVSDIETSAHAPVVASVGLPFLIVEIASYSALKRARVSAADLEKLRAAGIVPDVHLYVRSNDEFDIRARMFSPFDGVPEDPATGSANCALAALLTHLDAGSTGDASWRIAQGIEIGRTSILEARTRREGGQISTWIGGHSVLVGEGCIHVE